MDFIKLTNDEIKRLRNLSEYGYQFDWTKKSSDISEIVAFQHDGNITGLVEFERRATSKLNYMWLIEVADEHKGTGVSGKLLAYVGRDSLEAGFEGFVLFESKSYLYEYYIKAFNAKPVRGRLLMFDTETTTQLIDTYLKEENLYEK